MVLQETEMMVQTVLADTILTACRKTLPYQIKFTIEGMLHITLDEKEIILVNVKDTILKSDEKELTELTELKEDVIQTPKRGPVAKRKRGRRKKKVKYVESDEDFEPLPEDGSESDKVTEFPNLYSQMYTEEDKETGDANIKEEPCEGNGSKSESVIGAQETTAQLVDLAIQLAGVQENQDIKTSNEPPTSQEKHPNQSGKADQRPVKQKKTQMKEDSGSDDISSERKAWRKKTYSFMCDLCGKQYRTPGELQYHIYVHTGEKPNKCSMCNRWFDTENEMKMHESTHKVYTCKLCGKQCRIPRDLRNHMNTHTGEKPHQCSYCEMRFAQEGNKKQHELIHTGEKPHKCMYCQKAFRGRHRMICHQMIHTGERPYKCKYCGQSFRAKLAVVDHERTHTGEKPFKCPHCDKSFAKKVNLKPHIWTHTGEYPHRCGVCGAGFSRAAYLTKHAESHEILK